LTNASRRANSDHVLSTPQGGSSMVADAGPPLVLIALGLILWLAVDVTLAGISIQTVGLILFLVGVVWLIFEMIQARSATRGAVVDEPVAYREERVYRDRRL
jgi:hypothetical protein